MASDVFYEFSRLTATPDWLLLDTRHRQAWLVEERGILVWLLVSLARLDLPAVAEHLDWPAASVRRRFTQTRHRLSVDAAFRGKVGEIEATVTRKVLAG